MRIRRLTLGGDIWRATADEDGHYCFAWRYAQRDRTRERSSLFNRIAERAALFGFARGRQAAPPRRLEITSPDDCLLQVTRYRGRSPMASPAERMNTMRQRRRARGLRELRLVVADARSRAVRRRVARQVAGLDPDREGDVLEWIESVSEFDADATRWRGDCCRGG